METLVERCAGLDVHKDSVTACVRVADSHAGRPAETRRFTTTTAGLGLLARVAGQLRGDPGGMESTGCYWKPVWQLLEGQLECWLLNAAHLHHGPGRKTDVADAAWIAQLVEHGLVRPSLVPPRPVRELRELTRYRKTQIQERTREVQRLDKVLGGRRDPSCRVWPPTSSGSRAGRCWKPWWPAPTTRSCWPRWPRAGSGPSCQRCARRWPAASAPTITGCWSPRSWAISITWTRPSQHRLRGRRGPGKATMAVGHSVLVIAYHVLDQGVAYQELGDDYFQQRHSAEGRQRQLVHQLERLGHKVTLEPIEKP